MARNDSGNNSLGLCILATGIGLIVLGLVTGQQWMMIAGQCWVTTWLFW